MKLKLNSLIFAAVLVMILVTSVVYPEARVLSDFKYGSCDGSLHLYEEAIRSGQLSEEEVLTEIEFGALSQPVVAQLLDDGYCRQYVDRLKAGGWLAQDYSLPGSSSSSQSASTTTDSSSSTSQTTSTSKKEYSQEEIDAAWVETSRVEATCLEAGSIKYKNELTGKTKSEEIPVLEHSYEVTNETPSTCTKKGSITYTCTNCEDTYTEEVAMGEHSYEVTTEVSATCDADGYTEYTCKVCGDSYQDVIAQLQHVEGDWKTEQEVSLFTNGKEVKSCELCGTVLEEKVIEKTCPIPLGGVIAIAVVAIGAIVAGIVFGMKKKK